MGWHGPGTAPVTDVLRLITRLNVGGPARQALQLTHSLTPAFTTTLAAGRCGRAEGELADPRVTVHHVPLVRSVRPHADARALLAIRRLMVHTNPGLVHTHMSKAGAAGRIAAATLSPRPRTVHTFHGHVLSGYFSAPVQRAFVEAERRLARVTDVLIAVSVEVQDALLDRGIGHSHQYRVIPAGLDLDAFLAVRKQSGVLRRELCLSPDTPLVGVLGRLVPIKDIRTLFRAVAVLPGCHLAVLGDGESRGDLERGARALGVDDRVHFTGWRSDLPEVLSDMDVVALTSRNEGVPVALIEASAAGRPIVATRVGGVAMVVRDGITGYLVEAGDGGQLAAALRHLLENTGLRRRMGEEGRRHVTHRFAEKRLLADMADLYRELLPTQRRVLPAG